MKKALIVFLVALMMLSLAACGGEAAPETTGAPAIREAVDLQALYETLTAQMPQMVSMDATMMFNYCGIAAEDCAQAVAATCGDGLRTDEIWLIETVDEAALARIQALAETRLMVKDEESITYSPEQNAVVKKAQVITSGQYFVLVVSPDVEELVKLIRDVIG